jgi:hypothetical protein
MSAASGEASIHALKTGDLTAAEPGYARSSASQRSLRARILSDTAIRPPRSSPRHSWCSPEITAREEILSSVDRLTRGAPAKGGLAFGKAPQPGFGRKRGARQAPLLDQRVPGSEAKWSIQDELPFPAEPVTGQSHQLTAFGASAWGGEQSCSRSAAFPKQTARKIHGVNRFLRLPRN